MKQPLPTRTNAPNSEIPSIAAAPEGDRPRLERLSKLLARAPQDRSWRRRGFLVMCRTHQDRLRLRDTVEVPDGRLRLSVSRRSPQAAIPGGAR